MLLSSVAALQCQLLSICICLLSRQLLCICSRLLCFCSCSYLLNCQLLCLCLCSCLSNYQLLCICNCLFQLVVAAPIASRLAASSHLRDGGDCAAPTTRS